MALNDSYLELDQKLQERYNSAIKARCELLRKLVVDSPTRETDIYEPNGLSFGSRKFNDLLILGIFHWYFPDEIRFLVNFWLEENWGPNLKDVKAALLLSKETALGYLLVQDLFSSNDFYGNYVGEKQLNRVVHFLKLRKLKTSRPRKKVFRRGYNDKGSLSLPHQTKMYDYTKFRTVQEQLQIEVLEAAQVQQLLDRIRERLKVEKVG